MANSLREQGRPYWLIYLSRQRASMALLKEVAAHGSAAELYISSEGKRIDLQQLLSALPAGTQVCACGPEALLDTLTNYIEDLSQVQLTVEHFGSGKNLFYMKMIPTLKLNYWIAV